jgi:beta-mannosidase
MTNHEVFSFNSTPLRSNWKFKQGALDSTNENLPANDLPTEIFRDLLTNGKISDPFTDLNELSVRWVGDETWTYHTTFDPPVNYGQSGIVTRLKFEGLDTFATAYLNNEQILKSDNMFLEHIVNVTGKLKARNNVLEIVFESARKKGLDLVKGHPEHRFIVHQTEVSRGPVRKAQYQWGWDWGPILMSCGPWKPVLLETFICKIISLSVHYELGPDLKSTSVTASAACNGPLEGVMFTIVDKSTGDDVAHKYVESWADAMSVVISATFELEEVALWWPRGYGTQALYTIRADAQIETETLITLDTSSHTIGLRKVELMKEPDTDGTSFYFRINNVDIFIGGSCWIPADSFLTRISKEIYRSWIALAAEGNQNMLRVWGGGIYEEDAFYEAADELGIMIWQDFMFACASYPTYPEYLASVEKEAKQSVRQLRNHPSLVIWAGNNEDYQLVERYGLEYDYGNKGPEAWLKSNFPARYIYEHLLPNIIKAECPSIPYHPSSPFGNGKSTTLKVDPTIGDVHQWNVWNGTAEPYQCLPDMGGRFVSEFGMEAYPHVSTLEKCITRKEEIYPGSMTMDFRNKAVGHERKFMSYVPENFRMRQDLEGFTHLTQVLQADAMSWAYKGWRRQWGTSKHRKCGGVLVWQLNDCWPTISWAIVDYHLVPKPAYYAIKRAMEPVSIGVQRKFKPWTMRPADELWQRDTGHVDMQNLWRNAEIDVWIANSTMTELKGEIIVKCFSIATGETVQSWSKQDITILQNGATELLKDHVFIHDEAQGVSRPFDLASTDPYVVQALLYIDRVCIASDTAWPDPIKYLSFGDRGVDVQFHDNNSRILITAAKPVKAFVISEKEGVKLSNNGFDLMPNEAKEVVVRGCAANELKWMYAGI